VVEEIYPSEAELDVRVVGVVLIGVGVHTLYHDLTFG
jgi:hypothetical protein